MKALKILVPVLIIYGAVASFAWFKASQGPEDTSNQAALEAERLRGELAEKDEAITKLTERLDLLEDRLAKATGPRAPIVVQAAEAEDEFEAILNSEIEPTGVKIQENPMANLMKGIVGVVTNVFNPSNTNQMAKIGKAWQDQFKLRREGQIAARYADFLSEFSLDYEGREELIGLLAQQGWGGGGGPFGQGGGNPWDQGGGAEQQEEADAKLREFLGDDGYTKYEAYEETRYGRDELKDFEATLGKGALELNTGQRDHLITAFNDLEEIERQDRRAMWTGENINLSAEERAEKEAERLANLETEYNGILEESADVLDQEQHDNLSLHLTRKLQETETESEVNQAFQDMFIGSGGAAILGQPEVLIQTDIQTITP